MMDTNPLTKSPEMHAYLTKMDLSSGRNITLNTWAMKSRQIRKMEEFTKVDDVVSAARDTFMNTNKSLPDIISELTETLKVLSNKVAKTP